MSKTVVKSKPRVIYKPPPSATCAVTEDILYYMVPCPVCEKRTIDLSELPERPIRLRYKCPHCRNIVITPLTAATYDRNG